VTAAPGSATSAAVAWLAPATNGGSSIQSYQITSYPGGIKTNVNAKQTKGTVTGLQAGQSYTFTVAAVNAVGPSPESSPSNAVTLGGTPTNQAPTATITAPAAGASSAQGASVTFTGSGSDQEDGALSGASLVWTSSVDGQIGTGASFSTTALSVGTHTITLTAKDSKGATGTATRTITVTAATTTPPPTSSAKWVTGYYVGYQRSLYPETSVDFTYMTHVVIGSAEPTSTGGVDSSFWIDATNGPKMARALTQRAHAFGRKSILMIGGAGYDALLRSATSSAYRATFVRNLVALMNSIGFDGVDVDWEPVATADQPTILQFLKDLRAAKPGLIITFPVTWVNTNFGADAWYAQLAQQVDQLNLMSYDMAGNWGGWVSWHGAALAGEAGNHPSSVSGSVKAYVGLGVPAAKIGIGVGAYGDCWRGVSTMYQPLDGTSANVVASDNTMSYANIMSQYYSASAYKWDAAASEGYLSFAAPTGPAGCTVISYDDPQSLAAKGAYVKSAGLGGAIMWTINQQFLPSAAGGQQNPLLQAIYSGMQ
jgi:chitinase